MLCLHCIISASGKNLWVKYHPYSCFQMGRKKKKDLVLTEVTNKDLCAFSLWEAPGECRFCVISLYLPSGLAQCSAHAIKWLWKLCKFRFLNLFFSQVSWEEYASARVHMAYLTGDRGIMDEDGSFWWTGRADDVPGVLGSEAVNACGYCYWAWGCGGLGRALDHLRYISITESLENANKQK